MRYAMRDWGLFNLQPRHDCRHRQHRLVSLGPLLVERRHPAPLIELIHAPLGPVARVPPDSLLDTSFDTNPLQHGATVSNVRRECLSYIWGFCSIRQHGETYRPRLRIRRSQVRVLPSAPQSDSRVRKNFVPTLTTTFSPISPSCTTTAPDTLHSQPLSSISPADHCIAHPAATEPDRD
jgi:hypothetical protein